MKSVLILAVVLAIALCQDPVAPVWPESFEEAFDQKFIDSNTTYEVNGILYYDAKNNRSRLDRFNGRYDKFCSSLLPNLTTPCQSLVVEGKRWIIFPNRTQCCFCCDAEHGCGILKRNWLEGAVYMADEMIDNVKYHKWNKQGVVGYNYYWSSADDNNYPRRINENGAHIMEFNIHSYRNRTQDPKIFNLPTYCKDACPATSYCSKFRSQDISVSQ